MYTDLVKYAYRLVSVVEKMYEEGNNMAYLALLNGVGSNKVSNFPNQCHNYQAVIDAIHLYQKDNINKPVSDGYYEALLTNIRLINNEIAIQNIINFINYELKKEKDGTNSFELDLKPVLQELRNVIHQKYEVLKINNPNIADWLNYQDSYLNKNYGHKIL